MTMSHRLSILASVLLALFVLVFAQSAWVQIFHANALDHSTLNPRNNVSTNQYARGEIIAADGTVLAKSVATSSSANPWRSVYPLGSLTSDVVGFDSPIYTWGLEAEYNIYLTAHAQPAQSLEQILAPTTAANSVTLTLLPALQKVAMNALGARNGSVVAIEPKTGGVLALYSNPTFNPAPFTSFDTKVLDSAWKSVNKKDADGFPTLGLMATQQTFPPGSTFKIVTTAGIVAYQPSLLTKNYAPMVRTPLPDTNQYLYNDGDKACGGTVVLMLPQSCDPGYALLGLALGAKDLTAMANAFGFNEVPPLDMPYVDASYFPTESHLAANPPFLAYSAIGQEDVRATALQDALVASAIADGGAIMTPHLMSYISAPDGSIVKRYKDSVWKQPLTRSQASQIVPLMQDVVTSGTAYGVGFLPADDVAAKTGTAQTGKGTTDDWMIAFAPATDPTIAVAVSVPSQGISVTGAEVAGPIMKCVIEGALAIQHGLPPTGTSTTCPN
jgi:peptidoglycan glycosyltransferase